MSRQNRKIIFCFCFGLSNCNIIPLLHIHVMLNFIGQHHTGGISYTSLNNNGYFHGIYALCKHTISLTNFSFFFRMRVKCQILTCINFPKITYRDVPKVFSHCNFLLYISYKTTIFENIIPKSILVRF